MGAPINPLLQAPVRTPMVDPSGVLTPPWQYWYLNQQAQSAGGSGSGAAQVEYVTITGPTVIPLFSVPLDGQILVVVISMDNIGHAVAWDPAGYRYAPIVRPVPGTVGVAVFYGVNGIWTGQAMGVAP